jgi:hypothetical protein
MSISSIQSANVFAAPVSIAEEPRQDPPDPGATADAPAAGGQDVPVHMDEGAPHFSASNPTLLHFQSLQDSASAAKALKMLLEMPAGTATAASPDAQESAAISDYADAAADAAAGEPEPPSLATGGSRPRRARPTLLDARIAAARELFGAVGGLDAMDLLDRANSVHRDAVEHPLDSARRDLSMTLWNEESLQCARSHGEQDAAPKDRLEAYLKMWQLALNPPPPPGSGPVPSWPLTFKPQWSRVEWIPSRRHPRPPKMRRLSSVPTTGNSACTSNRISIDSASCPPWSRPTRPAWARFSWERNPRRYGPSSASPSIRRC